MQIPVPPLVAPGKWDNDIDYPTIKPALQLLSAILTADRMLQYIYMVFFTDHNSYRDENSASGRHHSMPPKDSLNADERSAARGCLQKLAKFVTFSIKAPGGVALARCIPGPRISQKSDKGFPGKMSHIVVAKELYDTIVDMYNKERDGKTDDGEGVSFSADLLKLYLFFATTILHEFGHSCQQARLEDDLDPKRAIGDSSVVCEGGYDLESWMFDGFILVPKPWTTRTMACLSEWPCALATASYLHYCHELWVDPAKGLPNPNTCTEWAVSDAWVIQIFKQRFWDRQASVKDSSAALRPLKLATKQVYVSQCRCRRHLEESLFAMILTRLPLVHGSGSPK
jgi:hypothetical protein